MKTNQTEYWTPSGYVKGESPEPYVSAVTEASAKIIDWYEALKSHGYHKMAEFGDNLQVRVWQHSDSHLYVELWNESEQLCRFCVNSELAVEFFATRYVELLRESVIIQQAQELARISKSLVAFIRHGHGEDTIDEYAEQSLDDVERRRAERQRLKAEAQL